MSRTKGSLNWKTKQKYLHDKYPDQNWMEETDKEVVNKHYDVLKGRENALAELVAQSEEMGLYIGVDLANKTDFTAIVEPNVAD